MNWFACPVQPFQLNYLSPRLYRSLLQLHLHKSSLVNDHLKGCKTFWLFSFFNNWQIQLARHATQFLWPVSHCRQQLQLPVSYESQAQHTAKDLQPSSLNPAPSAWPHSNFTFSVMSRSLFSSGKTPQSLKSLWDIFHSFSE